MVDEAVGNVTSFFRRWVGGALEHQHAPLPQDEDESGRPYRFSGGAATQERPWWLSWIGSAAPPGSGDRGDYTPTTLQDADDEMRRDEEYAVQQAMRRSRQDWRRVDPDWRSRDREEREESEEEREQRELEVAMEVSRREAEEAEKVRKAAEEAERNAAPLPDLLSVEGDLLGLADSLPSGSTGAGVGRTGQLVAYDPTSNDEAIARALNLLDLDASPCDSALLSKIEANRPRAPPPPSADVDLMGLVDAPSSPLSGAGLNGQSGALVPINPNKPLFRPSAWSQGICAGCNRKIDFGRFLNCLGKTWHPQCFKCKGCSLVISDQQFKAQEGDAFHDECYKTRFHPKCTVCCDYIQAGPDGMIQFRTLPFWEAKSCIAHGTDGTAQCTSCNRFEPRGTPYVDLKDGRKLCLECVDTVVVDSNDCMPLFLSIHEFFLGLGMPVKQEIPLLCVELQALNEAAEAEKTHGHSVTRGLCLSEEHTIRTVVRLPGFQNGLPFGGVGQREETLSRHCEVTAILVLYGLPRLLTGEILAHELMHAWFRLDGRFPPLQPDVEEGLCQVMAHLWLQSQVGSLSAIPHQPGMPEAFQSKFAEFCMHQIAMDSSPVYGEGFRRAYTATVQHGLLHTLDTVRQTGQLPH